jgi:hypothetical protein
MEEAVLAVAGSSPANWVHARFGFVCPAQHSRYPSPSTPPLLRLHLVRPCIHPFPRANAQRDRS